MKMAWLACTPALAAALMLMGGPRRAESVAAAPSGPTVQKASPAGAAGPGPDVRQESKAIGELVTAFVKAYNAKDAGSIAGQFAEDGRIVGPDGSVTEGREAIERRYREAFRENPDARIEVTTDRVRFLGADVAMEEGHVSIRSGGDATRTGRYHALYVRKDGRWLQSSVYDFADEPARATPADRLKDLEWLLGEWIDEGDGAVAHTTCRWDEAKAFLVRDFDLKVGARGVLSGTQRIGWDPSTGQFRSWVFDSEGGFSEGRWARDGDRWVIKNEGVVPDGRVVTATNVLSREAGDRARWSTTDRTLGGEALEDDAEVVLVRKPPKPM